MGNESGISLPGSPEGQIHVESDGDYKVLAKEIAALIGGSPRGRNNDISALKWFFITTIAVIGLLIAIGGYFTNDTVESLRKSAESSRLLISDAKRLFNAHLTSTVDQVVLELQGAMGAFSLNFIGPTELRRFQLNKSILGDLAALSVELADQEEAPLSVLLRDVNDGLLSVGKLNGKVASNEKEALLAESARVWDALIERELPRSERHQEFIDDFAVRRHVVRAVIEIEAYESEAIPDIDHLAEGKRHLAIAARLRPDIAQIYNYLGLIAYYRAEESGKEKEKLDGEQDCKILVEGLVKERELYRKALGLPRSPKLTATLHNNYADSFMTEAGCWTSQKRTAEARRALVEANRWIEWALTPYSSGVSFITAAQIRCEMLRLDTVLGQEPELKVYSEILALLSEAVNAREFNGYSQWCVADLLEKKEHFSVLGEFGKKEWKDELRVTLGLSC